jgi:uncharacterized membrane protein
MKTMLIAIAVVSAANACTEPRVITEVIPQGVPNGTLVSPVDIGDDGTVVVAVNSTAALLQENGAITQFPLPPGYTTCTPARRANDRTIVGTCSRQPTDPALASTFAVFWDASGAAHEIDTENLTNTSAIDINDNGIVVGYATQGTARTPWIYNLRTLELTVLSVPEGSIDTVASAINDSGDIVGTASFVELPRARPVMWANGTLALRSLLAPAYLDVFAHGINDTGVIVGEARDPAGTPLLPRNGTLVWESAAVAPIALPLPLAPPYSFSGRDWGTRGAARAINDDGRIIGEYGLIQNSIYSRGALWTKDRRAVDVDDGIIPVAINSFGRVVATRRPLDGPSQGALLIDW